MARNIKYIVIHCSAGSKNQKAKDILRYHINTLGWDRCGYHYIIEANGDVKKMIPEDEISNGVKNMNSLCINICYCGGIKQDENGNNCNIKIAQDTRTQAQRDSLINIVSTLKSKYPNAIVCSHNYFASKACPSFDAGGEYGGIPYGEKYKEGVKPSIASGGFQAAKSQVEQYKIAVETVGKALKEYPDKIFETYQTVVDTYQTVVDTLSNMHAVIDLSGIIEKLDPSKPVKEILSNIKDAQQGFLEKAKDLDLYYTVVPDGVEIPAGKGLPDLMEQMGILAILKDLISPATDFIKDAPSIIDQTLTNTKKSVSGATQNIVTTSSMLKESLAGFNQIQSKKGVLGVMDTGMEMLGSGLESGMNIATGVVGTATSTVTGIANVGTEAGAGAVSLALGAGAAVGAILAKIPGVIPKIITYAINYTAKKAIEKVEAETEKITHQATVEANKTVYDNLPVIKLNSDDNNIQSTEPITTDYFAVTGYESDEIQLVEPTILTSQTSDKVPNIYKDDFSATIGEVGIDSIEQYNKTNNNQNLSVTNNIDIEDIEENKELDLKALENSMSEDKLDAAEEAATALVNDELANKGATSDVPHINSEEQSQLIINKAEVPALNGLHADFINTFGEEEYNNLYIKVRESFLEILPEISDDDNSQNFVNMASFAALKLTPTLIEYINKKFEIFEERINTLVTTLIEERLGAGLNPTIQ